MKHLSLLVLKTPRVCIECPCHFAYESGVVICGAESGKELLTDDINNFKPDWCPLREVWGKERIMERFTEWTNIEKTEVSIVHYKAHDAMIRLAAYEDTGLTPEEIAELKEKNTVQKMYSPNPNIYYCRACGEKVAPMWDYCPWCGQHVTD